MTDDAKRFKDHCLEEIAKTFVMTVGEALACDPYATSQLLLARRVECGQALTLHPYIVVDELVTPAEDLSNSGGVYAIGVLGLLNGIVSKLSDHHLVCETAEDTAEVAGKTVTYTRVVGLSLQPITRSEPI